MRQCIDVFLFSSVYLALCAVGMVYQTMFLFQLPLSHPLLGFTFCGTLTSYNFHWYFTPASFGGSYKTNWSVRNRWIHAAVFLAGLVGAIYFGWQMRSHWYWLLLTAFITFLYSAPKVPFHLTRQLQRIAVGKTIFLAFAWAHVTTLLPLLISQSSNSDLAVFFVLNRFFLIYAICILFDYRDRESDRKEGIRSLLTHLEPNGILILFHGIMVAFAVSLFILAYLGFAFGQLAALALPGILLLVLRNYSMRHTGDYHYYFVLDGLMALSVPLVCFF